MYPEQTHSLWTPATPWTPRTPQTPGDFQGIPSEEPHCHSKPNRLGNGSLKAQLPFFRAPRSDWTAAEADTPSLPGLPRPGLVCAEPADSIIAPSELK